MTCHASMTLTAGALAAVQASAGVPRRLLRLFTVDVERGRRSCFRRLGPLLNFELASPFALGGTPTFL